MPPAVGPHAAVVVAWPEEDAYRWRENAACALLRAHEKAMFYGESRGDEQKAKAVCATCPVMAECRDYAMTGVETWGVWGGLTVQERRCIRARRRAGEVSQAQTVG